MLKCLSSGGQGIQVNEDFPPSLCLLPRHSLVSYDRGKKKVKSAYGPDLELIPVSVA